MKWEYDVVTHNNVYSPQAMQGKLNTHGELGWELVNIHQKGPELYLIFKREAVTP